MHSILRFCGALLLVSSAVWPLGLAKAQDFIRPEALATGLTRPVGIAHAGDGSGRLFIVEQGGQVLIHDGEKLLRRPFLDISQLVTCCREQGLLGIAFHPRYGKNRRFFLHYTDRDGNNVVARYRVSSRNPNRALARSERILLTVPQPRANHNGGQIAFGPDGYLYIAIGDGGGGGDPDNLAQNRRNLLGNLLRIDVDQGLPYSVPADNPFVGQTRRRDEIWVWGLRNPWRFSFDRLTGDLFIGDVGQRDREEIDFQAAGSPGGENFGWPVMEGRACFKPPRGCERDGKVLPILQYRHLNGNCSVTGGYVYRGSAQPAAAGLYFFGDFCSGRVWAASDDDRGWRRREVLDSSFLVSTFGEDEAGELYLADIGGESATIYRLSLLPALGALQPAAANRP